MRAGLEAADGGVVHGMRFVVELLETFQRARGPAQALLNHNVGEELLVEALVQKILPAQLAACPGKEEHGDPGTGIEIILALLALSK